MTLSGGPTGIAVAEWIDVVLGHEICRLRYFSFGLSGSLEGWVAFTPEGRYKFGGEIAGGFWHSINLCRFEPGALDPYLPEPLRMPDDEPFILA